MSGTSPLMARNSMMGEGEIQEQWENWPKERREKLHSKLKEMLRHLESERTCKVCLSEEVSRAFRRCGHLCCCSSCATEVKNCPICREPVEGLVVVVFPKARRMTLPADFNLFLQRHSFFGV